MPMDVRLQKAREVVIANPTEALKYWVDIDEMSNVTLQPILSKSQRPPAPVNLTFEFPYHGHPINNVTIATEGFLHLGNPIKNVIAPYISNPIPSWLADIQNVAPLLTDLYESSWLYESSKIKYAGNSTMFVVQWENFTCEELPQKFFTFQVSLFPNGDIVFVYKDFPVSFPFTIR
uniref:Uncharacterized protein n=1 Tax=Tetranychus urticae TaxID=32264 RepID=T1L0L3_TETUR